MIAVPIFYTVLEALAPAPMDASKFLHRTIFRRTWLSEEIGHG